MLYHGMNLGDILALAAVIFSVLVPLFWIPVHCLTPYFRKLGIFTYILPAVTWLPVAWLLYSSRALLLRYTVDMPWALRGIGALTFIAGMLLQIWTLRLLGTAGIMGLPEVTHLVEGGIVTEGPFSVIRHPTYASHTLMYAGVFLITGVIAVGIITVFDLLIVNAVVIPLEDRELIGRFGNAYRKYKERVPAFFPRRVRK
jgi:protein-S-isoprenylcysteine O-methyltransferase Ste14